MNINKNTKIGVVGFGVEGVALTNYLLKNGYRNIAIFDEKESAREMLKDIVYGQNRALGILTHFGKSAFAEFGDCELLFRSPGIHPDRLRKLAGDKVRITSTTQYFMENCPCPIIGVTGTKGKGSTLIYLMLQEGGFDVYLGGNIGESPLNFLEKLTPQSKVVLEMSSFQLQDLTVSPKFAVVLNVSSDHLDYHLNVEEYRQAKTAIVRFQNVNDFVVLNADYEIADFYEKLTPAKKLWVSTKKIVDHGADLENGKIVLKKKEEILEVAEIEKIALFGSHHLENILPAVCVVDLNGVAAEAMRKVLYSFKGLPHRLQQVAEIQGVKYYDDSIATTPETSLAAVRAFNGPVILIAGGSDKNADYSEWAEDLQKNPGLKMVLLIGATAEKMATALASSSQKNGALLVEQCKTLEEAVKKARIIAKSGMTVLLSPAAASFGMFKDYKERGEQFCSLVSR